jgi:hypothetical protein
MRLSRILAVVGIPLMCGAAVIGAGAASAGAATKAPPSITANPSSTTVLQGAKASFLAAATAGTVQWEVSSDGGATFTAIAGATSHRYTIAHVTLGQDANEFEATFTTTGGHATTDAATLRVTPLVAPQVTQSPANVTIPLGGTATFSAAGYGTPAPKVKWYYSKNDGASFAALGKDTTTTLTVTPTSYAQSGYEYEAVFTNTVGSTATAPATLIVGTAPVITLQPTNVSVVNTAKARFSTTASGAPSPTVQWLVSTNGGATFTPVANGTSSVLVLNAVTLDMSGNEYEAVFTNAAGSVTSSPATLNVGPTALVIDSTWAGYVDTGATFTSVSGSWNVPSVTCGPSDSDAAQWVGIDGFLSTTVEQVGTNVSCSGGVAQYDAWWEMYGDVTPATNDGYSVGLDPSTYPVIAGDEMTGNVSYGSGNWTLSVSDATQGWSFTTVIASPNPPAAQSSAEWVVERPETVNAGVVTVDTLADTGSVTFTNAQVTSSTASGSIGDFTATALAMSPNGHTMLAQPGYLTSTGSAFTVSVTSPAN